MVIGVGIGWVSGVVVIVLYEVEGIEDVVNVILFIYLVLLGIWLLELGYLWDLGEVER